MPSKREVTYLTGGIVIGVYGTKKVPKLEITKYFKYVGEVWAVYRRLQKVMIEEYYRLEEAIDAEETYLRMIKPNPVFAKALNVSFDVIDGPDGQRSLRMNFKKDEPQSG